MSTYPMPDRSRQHRSRADVGWHEGVLPDGRPFRMEMWSTEGISNLTFFVPSEGLDLSSRDLAKDFVERMGLVRFLDPAHSCAAMLWHDDSGRPAWSINMVLGDEDGTFLDTDLPVQPFPPEDPGLRQNCGWAWTTSAKLRAELRVGTILETYDCGYIRVAEITPEGIVEKPEGFMPKEWTWGRLEGLECTIIEQPKTEQPKTERPTRCPKQGRKRGLKQLSSEARQTLLTCSPQRRLKQGLKQRPKRRLKRRGARH